MMAQSNLTVSSPITTEQFTFLLEKVYKKYGYDYRNYSAASLMRRTRECMLHNSITDFNELMDKIGQDSNLFENLFLNYSVNTTEMFRDPDFYKNLRSTIIPYLRTYPSIKIWHAGCSTGQEVYSMAILLQEEGLLDRTFIYATDINKKVLNLASTGVYSADSIAQYTSNYQASGGIESFGSYFSKTDEGLKIVESLKKNILFSAHNLVSDWVFSEMNLIICRNVFIYFNRTLQERILKLFYESLVSRGFLCLGSKESLSENAGAIWFNTLDQKRRLFQKKD